MNPPADVASFREAVEWFRARVPVTDEEFDELTEEARAQAFKVAGAAQLDLVNDVWQAIDRALSEGTTLADFKDEVADRLIAAWGAEIPGRLETIFRTNVQTAYGRGRYAQMTDPAVKEARPFWRFNAILDSRTTAICRPLEGTILPADSPWWRSHQPPLHFNCRSAIETLTEKQANEEGGPTSSPPPSSPAPGFGQADEEWSPSPEKYPPDLWRLYEKRQRQAA